MRHDLDRNRERHLPGHALDRPQRDGDAEREQCARRGGVLEKLHQPVERDGRLEMHRGRRDAEHRRDDERMRHDALKDLERGRGETLAARIRQRHQERHEAEQQQRVEAEDQRDRHVRGRAERRERQAGPHVADVAVGAGKPCDRGLGHVAPEGPADAEGERERGGRREHCPGDETRIAQFLERCLREDAIEQARKREVDQEEAHPGEPGFGNPELQLAADEAEKDQPEERQGQIEDVEHRLLLLAATGPVNAAKSLV